MFLIWRLGTTLLATLFTTLFTATSWLPGAGPSMATTGAAQQSVRTPAHAASSTSGPTSSAKKPAPSSVEKPAPQPVPKPTAVAVARPNHLPLLGVYAGPASKGVAGAAAFATLDAGAPPAVLDFGATQDWYGITGPNWLLDPRVGSSARLEYSLPMFPDGAQYSLASCAAGAYNTEWQRTAQSLVRHGLSNTIVRPGWEFNGTWYHWSAKNDISGFVGCFRQIVTTMRGVAGQHLAFDWNPNLGAAAFPAEHAYPGDAYVDYVGVDIYDTSWSYYPSSNMPSAQAAAWNDDVNGDHGLAFWSRFAAAHHKSMSVPEWGVAFLSNGHGGGDDPAFVNHMFEFMTNPANHVAYAHYFDWTSGAGDHKLTGATRFPASAAEYRHHAGLIRTMR